MMMYSPAKGKSRKEDGEVSKKSDAVITVKEAARILNMSEMTLRVGLQDTESPWHDIGYAYRKPGSKNYSYGVFKGKLEEYIGKSISIEPKNNLRVVETQVHADDGSALKRA